MPRKYVRDRVAAYARAVGKGKIIAGLLVRAQCARHLRDLKYGKARGLRWDCKAAQRAMRFFPDVLRLAEGAHAGQPFRLEPWQQFIVGSLFGWRGTDGFRRFRTAYIEAAKGSGKSPLAAGIGLYMLVADGELGAECYAAAVTRDQAGILFNDATRMVAASRELSARVTRGIHNLAYFASGSYFRPLSSEARSLDGKRVHYAAIDEVHEHRTADVVDKMRAGTKGRRQALIFLITNSGVDRNSVCFRYHEYAGRVARNETEDDSLFTYVCGLDPGDSWRDESVWAKSNPNIGVSIALKYLREQVREAEGMPSKQSLVRRLNFCEWVEAEAPWIGREHFEACLAPLDKERLRGRPCYGGLDLSSKADLTALALVFPAGDGTFDAFVRYWKPADSLREHEEKDRAPYTLWRDQGFLRTTPGLSIDYGFVAVEISHARAEFDLREIAFDRWRIDDLMRELADASVLAYDSKKEPTGRGLNMSPHGQGFHDMTPALEALETAVLNGKLRLESNPVTVMCSANATLETDPAGNRKFSKRRAHGRIDGIVALAMAMRRAAALAPPAAKSFWETAATPVGPAPFAA